MAETPVTAIPTRITKTRPAVPELEFNLLRIKHLVIDATNINDPVVAICKMELYGIDQDGSRVVAPGEDLRVVRIDDLLGKMSMFPEAAAALAYITQMLQNIIQAQEEAILNPPPPPPPPEPEPEPETTPEPEPTPEPTPE